jgi:hypothetical protein
MKTFFSFVVAFVLAWAGVQDAHAGRGVDRATGQALWDAAVKGRTTTIGVGSGAMKVISPAGTTTALPSGASKVSGSGTVPVADKQVPVGFTGEVAKDAIVGGVLGCATGGVVGCVIGAGVPLAAAYMSLSNVRSNADQSNPNLPFEVLRDYEGIWDTVQNPATSCRSANPINVAHCAMLKIQAQGTYPPGATFEDGYIDQDGPTQKRVRFKVRNCCAGTSDTAVVVVKTGESSGTWYPATTAEAREALYKNTPNPGIVDELSKYGNITWPLGNVQTSGPAEVKGPKSTSVTQSGNRTDSTVSQETTPITYAGPDVTAGNPTRTSTTTSTTTNPDGSTSTTTSTTTETVEQGNEPPKPEEQPPTDTALPPVPDLYVRKYPNGMEGIYDQYKDQLKNTSLVQLAKQLMPNVGSGGQCPSWPMNFNLAEWAAYGTYDVAPPCWIWTVAKAILILSALLLARALIFGG